MADKRGAEAAAAGADAVTRLARLTIRHRYAVVAITVAIVALLALGLGRLTFNPETRAFFGEGNPKRIALEALEETYSSATNVILILVPKNGNVFTREFLSLVEEVTEQAWQTPHSFRVDSLANYQHSFARGDEFVIEDLFSDAAGLGDADLDRVRETALGSDQLVDRILSPAGDVTAVTVLIDKPAQGSREAVGEIAAHVRALAAEIEATHPGVTVRLSGGIMADVTFGEAGRRDLATLIPIMLALIVAALWVGLRSWSGTMATMSVVAMSVVAPLGVAGHLGVVLDVASAGTPIMIMSLCIADCVHVLATLAQRRRAGDDTDSAIVAALRLNMMPIAVTSVTTAVGFLSLNFSEAPPLRMLGNIVAGGMLAGFVLSVTFLPAFLRMTGSPGSSAPVAAGLGLRALADFTIRYRRIILPAASIVVVVLASGLFRIVIDDNFVTYFDDRFEFRRDTDFMQERLTGLHGLLYSVPSGEEQGVMRPDYLATLDRFTDWFEQQDKVVYASSIAETMKRLNRNMHGDDPAFERVPDSRELAAQYFLLYEMSLPFGLDFTNSIDISRASSLVVVRLRDASSVEIRELGEAGERWLAENAPAMATTVTGLSTVYAYLTERNIQAMIGGTAVALALISLTLLFVLRNARIGAISLVPNLVPAAMSFGLWGYVVGEVNLAVSVVGAMTLGIVVDDTVHFLSKYVWARRSLGMAPHDAIRHTFELVGPALVQTSVALVLGFGVLALSGFAISSQMGLLSAVTIVAALVADLVLLPALILTVERDRP